MSRSNRWWLTPWHPAAGKGTLAVWVLALAAVIAGCDRGGRDADDDADAKAKRQAVAATNPATAPAAEVKLTPAAIAYHGIRIEKARRHVLVRTVVAPARVAYDREATAQVGSAAAGRAVDVKARLGDVVKAGDELAAVESPALGEAQSDYLQKRTAAAAVPVALGPLKSAYERGKQLYDQGQGVSLADVQKREADYRAAQSGAATAEAALKAAENRLQLLGMDADAVARLAASGLLNARYVVRAPIGGTVVGREVTPGQLVSPDRDVLFVLADLATVWVMADVPESRASEVKAGAKATVTLAAAPDSAFEGTVSYVGPELADETRTLPVRVVVKNDRGSLRPGMFARAEIAVGVAAGEDAVLAVPEQAVVTVEGRTVVFVPDDEENTFRAIPVMVGRAVGGMVPVLSGLKERKELVTAGTFVLKAELAKSQVPDND